MVLNQVTISGSSTVLSAGATRHNRIESGGATWLSSQADREQMITTSVTVKNLRVKLVLAPGASAQYTFSIIKNGTATSVVAVISDSETQDADEVNTAAFVAGDTISIRCVGSGTPVVTTATWTITLESANSVDSVLIAGHSNNISNSNTEYNHLQGGANWSSNEGIKETIISRSGTIKNLYIETQNAPGDAPNSYAFAIRKNGVTTDLAVTISTGITTGNNTSDTVTVAAGDLVTIQCAPTDTPTIGHVLWGVTFVSDADDEYIIMGATGNNLSNAATEFNYLQVGGSTIWTVTEADRLELGQATGTVKNFYVELDGPPNAGNSYTFDIRQNSASPGLQVVISDTDTANSNTVDTFDLTDYDDMSIQSVPASTPISRDAKWGFTVNTAGVPPIASAEIALFQGVAFWLI